MPRTWTRESPARWDVDKERIVGGAEPGALPLTAPAAGELLNGTWWRVSEDGQTLGYGWMEVTWGDGVILLAVSPDFRRGGVGAWILRRLEAEAGVQGLNYLTNVVSEDHPRKDAVTAWLVGHGFRDRGDGALRRQVRRELLGS